jgi:hypothetical protein
MVFIVQVTKLVQFTYYNIFLKIPLSTSMHFATRVRTQRVTRLYSETALPRKPFRIGHVYMHTYLLRITDIMTSQNIDLSPLDTLYSLINHNFSYFG